MAFLIIIELLWSTGCLVNLPQGLKRGLVVSKRLTEAYIWLIINLTRAIVETILIKLCML